MHSVSTESESESRLSFIRYPLPDGREYVVFATPDDTPSAGTLTGRTENVNKIIGILKQYYLDKVSG